MSKTLIKIVTSLRLKEKVVHFERDLKMKKITVELRPKNNKILNVKEPKLKKNWYLIVTVVTMYYFFVVLLRRLVTDRRC